MAGLGGGAAEGVGAGVAQPLTVGPGGLAHGSGGFSGGAAADVVPWSQGAPASPGCGGGPGGGSGRVGGGYGGASGVADMGGIGAASAPHCVAVAGTLTPPERDRPPPPSSSD